MECFEYALILTRSRLGLLCVNFHKPITGLCPLIGVKNFVSYQYLENKWMEFDQILHMPLYTSLFLQICIRVDP